MNFKINMRKGLKNVGGVLTPILSLLILLLLVGCQSEMGKGELKVLASNAKGGNQQQAEVIQESSNLFPGGFPVNGGNFRLGLTDKPNKDVAEVWINIDRIELKTGGNGTLVIADNVGLVDLLKLQNGKVLDLGEMNLPIGLKVTQARLILREEENHLIFLNGERCDLQTPSQQNSGLKLISPQFEVREGEAISMIIDFDALESLVFQGNGGCLLKPVLRWAKLESVPANEVNNDGTSDEEGDDLTDGQDPVTEEPVTKDPVVEDPVKEDPVVEDPVTEEPVTEDPVVEDPVTEDPVTEEPVTEDPVVEDPVTEDPVTEDPVVEDPVTEDPVTEEPVTEDPVVEDPVTEEPVTEDPVIEDPVTEDPVTEEPVTEDPVIEDPVTEDPVTEDPVVEEPVTVDPNLDQNGGDLNDCQNAGFDLYDSSQWPSDFVFAEWAHCY